MVISVTYAAVLSARKETVLFLSGLLHAERQRRGTRTGRRALGCFAQAVLVLRWFLDGTRVVQLAADNAIGGSTAYRYLHQGIDVLAARRPTLHSALLATKAAGYSHVNLDGTLVTTDRVAAPGPTRGVDLWWSGKHHRHGGNIQVISAPDGWPLWTSDVRPGREHDTTCLRYHDMLGLLTEVAPQLPTLADLGYEGEAKTLCIPIKKPAHGRLTDDQRTTNLLHAHLRSQAERANSLLAVTLVEGKRSKWLVKFRLAIRILRVRELECVSASYSARDIQTQAQIQGYFLPIYAATGDLQLPPLPVNRSRKGSTAYLKAQRDGRSGLRCCQVVACLDQSAGMGTGAVRAGTRAGLGTERAADASATAR